MRTCLPLKGYVHYFQVNHALRNFNFCDVTYFLPSRPCAIGVLTEIFPSFRLASLSETIV